MRAQEMFDLSGKVAAVTGAASGLGLAIADVLSANGAHVALLDVDAAALADAARHLTAKSRAVETHTIDVADTSAIKRCIDDIAAAHGRLDIAVANAGITAGRGYTDPTGRIEAVDEAAWNRVLAVNLTGAFATMRAAAAQMRPRRSGRIIVIASIAGLQAEPMVGYAYSATKAALVNLVRHAAMDLARDNVLVTGIAPGPFRTNIAGGRIREPAVEKAFADLVPLGRIAEPDEIKGLALLLASPASSYLTGVVIPIDGGATAD